MYLITLKAMCEFTKKVLFNLDKNQTYDTYSSTDYDRHAIDSVLVRKLQNKVGEKEWHGIFKELNEYKLDGMTVHKSTLNNMQLH